MNIYKTSDGYMFYEQANGTLTDTIDVNECDMMYSDLQTLMRVDPDTKKVSDDYDLITSNFTERGAASVKVILLNGAITVLHGDTGKVLLERKAYKGDWNRIWAALEGEIPSADIYRAAYYKEV
tara:strand:+ start:89 stop:460 length:372 start_codon:yes stop_codon:yes gene_type:complete